MRKDKKMTLPMTVEEKREYKKEIMNDLFKIHLKTGIIKRCMQLSDKNDFEGDHLIFSKDMALDISDLAQRIEHRFHEILDAPIISDELLEKYKRRQKIEIVKD